MLDSVAANKNSLPFDPSKLHKIKEQPSKEKENKRQIMHQGISFFNISLYTIFIIIIKFKQ
jgi:hypothetical protein